MVLLQLRRHLVSAAAQENQGSDAGCLLSSLHSRPTQKYFLQQLSFSDLVSLFTKLLRPVGSCHVSTHVIHTVNCTRTQSSENQQMVSVMIGQVGLFIEPILKSTISACSPQLTTCCCRRTVETLSCVTLDTLRDSTTRGWASVDPTVNAA